jgi:hypothetical protein
MKKFQQSEFTGCLQLFGEESLVFPFAIQNRKIKIHRTLIVPLLIMGTKLLRHNEKGS